MNAPLYRDGREFDESKVVGGKLVVADGDTAVLLDLVEEPLNQIAHLLEIRAEADRLLAISFLAECLPTRVSGQ
jgi:hypothetical protein